MKRSDKLAKALLELVRAMEKSVEVGCTDHLDCWDDSNSVWYAPLWRAKKLLEIEDE